ncbi:hypothetical protein [Actinacidiphila acididurans]|uniref:Uncharacterized protein n=1 Tax=Actinacidiphila acididurans TaxID=2784346 RepID=A0ABS2U1E6_9ACTN|nr:hypothetical protein [Actinacidiphila acididurans]MBM9508013.1 hypothetical protein [Actinacidiphila acididurans]
MTPLITDLWGDVEVDGTRRSEVCAFRWSFSTDEGPGEVCMPEDGTGLYLDATLPDSARLACSMRAFVPDDVEMVFCDEGYTFDVLVSPGASVAELIIEVNAQP